MLHLPEQPETTQQSGQQVQPDYTEYIEYSQPYQPQVAVTPTPYEETAPQAAAVDTSQEETPPPLNPGSPTPPSSPSRRPRGWRTAAIVAMTFVMLLVFGVGLFSGWAYSRGTAATATSTATATSSTSASTAQTSVNSAEAVQEAVIQKVSPSVVEITVQTAQGTVIGSGVIFDTRGYIVTNAHVVSGAQSIQVTLYDGTTLNNVHLVGSDTAHDLAVIKISTPKALVAATFGNSSQVKAGEDVLAIGNPLGIKETVTNGIVSAINRTVTESQTSATISNAIQTDAPINPGNSGGALVDLQGHIIGILTLGAVDSETNTLANGVGFAIPSNTAQSIANQIIQSGQ